MAGIGVGAAVFGHLADTYGRRHVFIIVNVLALVGQITQAFSTSWQLFAVIRLFIGFFVGEFCDTIIESIHFSTLKWSHNGRDGISNHQPHDCLLNRLFRCRAKKASKVRATGLCERYSLWSVEFPAQMSSNAENVSIWWRHHGHLIMQVKPSSQAAKSYIVVT